MKGEWWIDDTGQVLFADGDIGDMNHEMYVLDWLTRTILDTIGGIPYNEEYAGSMDAYNEEVREALEIASDASLEVLCNAVEEALREVWTDTTQRAAAIDAAYNLGDPRAYAIRYNGWKRLKGTNIETWTLTKEDLLTIVQGIHEAADGELHDGTKFFIEVRASGKCFSDVPWGILQDASPSKLREYQML